ncbi:MAG: low molecular weight protein-tyrosine-phosphatase [Gammaproteobacteria bacterium]
MPNKDMSHHFLILCTGNICRSPMAEAVFKARFTRSGFSVESAGLAAPVGAPACALAVELMAERGVDISDHRARQVTWKMLERASLILTMDTSQQQAVVTTWPASRGRVQLLGRWSGTQIADPYRQGRQAYQTALAAIERGLLHWEHWLIAGNPPKPLPPIWRRVFQPNPPNLIWPE